MWNTIKEVLKPANFAEACSLVAAEKKVLFAGGSYLASVKAPAVNTLIDINGLIDGNITLEDDKISIGAGATLQDMIEQLQGIAGTKVAECARMSCASKNIRNQRTIGGEIAFRRSNSELNVCLHALNATLLVAGETMRRVSVQNWRNEGVVTAVEIQTPDNMRVAVERYALLPSAPAFVIVAGVLAGESIGIAAGGAASGIAALSIRDKDFGDDFADNISPELARFFRADHHGSMEYKMALIKTGLNRVRTALCDDLHPRKPVAKAVSAKPDATGLMAAAGEIKPVDGRQPHLKIRFNLNGNTVETAINPAQTLMG